MRKIKLLNEQLKTAVRLQSNGNGYKGNKMPTS